MKNLYAGLAAGLLLLGTAGTATATVGSYTITDLGTLGGLHGSVANAINNSGQVVGQSYNFGGTSWHATLWDNGVATDLGVGSASGINNSGQVVGGSRGHATLWDNGVATDLGVGSASGINNSGQVVGGSRGHATLWDNGVATDLGTLGGTTSGAVDINNSGQVVGNSYTARNTIWHATLWNNGVATDLGTLGWMHSIAWDINDSGQVVGQYFDTEGWGHATLWSNGVATDLGNLDAMVSNAVGINNSGQVVGSFTQNEVDSNHAMLWTSSDGVIDLNTLLGANSGFSYLLNATAINDNGQIVGDGVTADGVQHAFLMTPVPIPGAVWLLGSGLFGLAGLRRFRKNG